MRHCDCGSEMVARPNKGNVWECQSLDCDCVEMIKYCTKCNRILHDPVLQDEDDERCICCSDLMGHEDLGDGETMDWDEVECCPSCGSFDVQLGVDESIRGGGRCNSCEATWDDEHTMGCLGGDWDGCRETFTATIIGQQQVYTHLEKRARGPEDAAAMFKAQLERVNKEDESIDWEGEDDSDPYDAELIEITNEEGDETVWTRPGQPELKDVQVFEMVTPTGWIRSYGEGDTVRILQASYDSEGTETIAEFTFSRYALAAIDMVRTKS